MQSFRVLVALLALLLLACDTSPSSTPATQGRVLVPVGEPVVSRSSALVQAIGRVKNTHATQAYSGIINVTLFDADGKVTAVLNGAVNSIPPGEEVSYTVLGGEASTHWTRAEVKIGTELPG